MAKSKELSVQEKKELASKEEKTVPSRYFVPSTDIYEGEEALTMVMEMPGVEREDVNVQLENDVLRVEGGTNLVELLFEIEHPTLPAPRAALAGRGRWLRSACRDLSSPTR